MTQTMKIFSYFFVFFSVFLTSSCITPKLDGGRNFITTETGFQYLETYCANNLNNFSALEKKLVTMGGRVVETKKTKLGYRADYYVPSIKAGFQVNHQTKYKDYKSCNVKFQTASDPKRVRDEIEKIGLYKPVPGKTMTYSYKNSGQKYTLPTEYRNIKSNKKISIKDGWSMAGHIGNMVIITVDNQ